MMASRQYNEDPSPIGGAPMARPAAGGPCRNGGFVLRFESLSQPGRTLDFPCDGSGRVDLDALGEAARSNYLFARAVVGRGFSAPVVVAGGQAPRQR
jgi:hypothetical protein